MDELIEQFPWIGDCVKRIDVTNVGQQHDLIDLVKSDVVVLDETKIKKGSKRS